MALSTSGSKSSPAVVPSSDMIEFNVELGDFFIKPSGIDMPAGAAVTLRVSNTGAYPHDLVVDGTAPIADEDSADHFDGPPSEHLLKRRVRLVVAVCDGGVASVLRFADTPDDVICDPGAARGSLADAVNSLWFDPPVVVPRERR